MAGARQCCLELGGGQSNIDPFANTHARTHLMQPPARLPTLARCNHHRLAEYEHIHVLRVLGNWMVPAALTRIRAVFSKNAVPAVSKCSASYKYHCMYIDAIGMVLDPPVTMIPREPHLTL